jgi:hypothetical protein
MQIYLKYDIYNNFKEIKKNNKKIKSEYRKNFRCNIEQKVHNNSFTKYNYKLYNIIFKYFTNDEIYKYIIKNITVDFFIYMFKNIKKSIISGFPCYDGTIYYSTNKNCSFFTKKLPFFLNNVLNKQNNMRNEIVISYNYKLWYNEFVKCKDVQEFYYNNHIINNIYSPYYCSTTHKILENIINDLSYINQVRTLRFVWIFIAVSII